MATSLFERRTPVKHWTTRGVCWKYSTFTCAFRKRGIR